MLTLTKTLNNSQTAHLEVSAVMNGDLPEAAHGLLSINLLRPVGSSSSQDGLQLRGVMGTNSQILRPSPPPSTEHVSSSSAVRAGYQSVLLLISCHGYCATLISTPRWHRIMPRGKKDTTALMSEAFVSNHAVFK